MSRDAGEELPSRGPKPRPESRRPAGAKGEGGRDEPTTWRPNPKNANAKTGANADPGQARTRAATDVTSEQIPQGPSWWERIFFGRVSSGQLAMFCRQFAAYLDAGVDLLKALSSLERLFARTALGPVTGRLMASVKRGDALAEAFDREPQVFDRLFLSMIKVAEARGGIPETLRMLSRHYEARQTLIRQARAALIYPIAVLVVAAGVMALFTIWLLPMLLGMLKDVAGPGSSLPLPSRILMAFGGFIGTFGWWLVPLLMVATPLLIVRSYRTVAGKRLMDETVLRVPVFGKLLTKLDTTRFARALATLMGSGVDVGTSLDLAADVMQLEPFRRAIQGAKGAVLDGTDLSVALGVSRRFGPDVIAIIESGEETGKLPESLEHLADDYQEQVTYMVKNLGQLVQPLLYVMLGGLVLFIILAVFLPYISLVTNLAGPR